MKLNAKKLRAWKGERVGETLSKNEIYIILDNVLDTYNIGSIFRLSDAAAIKRLYLCGRTETPPNHRIKKASINTTNWVEWEYAESALQVINDLRAETQDIKIIAIEQSKDSIPYTQFKYKKPMALIVGHESYGVSEEVLKECDAIVELPMHGVNVSLNVMVSLAIVLYHALGSAGLNLAK